jgi:hypothetical protein
VRGQRRPPVRFERQVGVGITGDNPDHYFGDDGAPDLAEAVPGMPRGRLKLHVYPQRRLPGPVVLRAPEFVLAEHFGADETGDALSRRQAKTVSALKVPCGERGVDAVARRTRNGFRKAQQRRYKAGVNRLGTLCQRISGYIEEQRPVYYPVSDRPETHQVRKEPDSFPARP